MIIINSAEKAISMLQRTKYSNRASSFFMGEMVGWKHLLGFLNDGPQFRAGHRLFQQTVGTRPLTQKFAPMTQAKTQEFIQKILDDPSPEALKQHIRAYGSAIILDLAYGYQVKDRHDKFVAITELALSTFTTVGLHGTYLVDRIPWRVFMPYLTNYAAAETDAC